jgi:PKD repeat protein
MAGARSFGGCLLVTALLSVMAAPAQAQGPLLSNGDFETGVLDPWSGASGAQVTAAAAHAGTFGVHLPSAQLLTQGWIPVTPGRTYVVTAWFRWAAFGGDGWGYDLLDVVNTAWQAEAAVTHLSGRYPQHTWVKLALTFVATTSAVQVRFGVHGPRSATDQSWDDFQLFEKIDNQPPVISPSASASSGHAPLVVSFDANAHDSDGAIAVFHWDFGDGRVATTGQTAHTFTTKGTHTVRLTVWDHDGASATATLAIMVLSDANPAITIAAPTLETSYTTGAMSISLAGTASAPDGRTVQSVVWDNVDTDEAAIVDLPAAANVSWNVDVVRLKPGRNELFVTTTDSTGRVGTARLLVTRTTAGPIISNIVVSSATVPVYEKVEVAFDLDTVADHPLFRYDATPPPGVAPGTGVTVEGIVVTPSGQTLVQPGYAHGEVITSPRGASVHYAETGRVSWRVRFSPLQTGTHTVSVRVQDASGTVEMPVGTFTATSPARRGFIGVSADDPRYFAFSNGDLYYPIGPANGPDYAQYEHSGLNLERPWMAGLAAYSTNWARWMRVDLQLGNEGVDSPLVYTERYPGHELSRELFAPGGHRIWMGAWQDESFHPALAAGRQYLIKLRIKTLGIAGPAAQGLPYGFMVKTHGFPTSTIDSDLRAAPSIVPVVHTDRDWHTLVVRYTAGPRDADGYISLLLDNVTAGRVYIDQFSIREVSDDGAPGGELIRHARADMHTYVEQRPAAYLDWQVEQGERYGVFFKYVVQDKRDWVPNHLTRFGTFATVGDGYFQPDGTKATWLQQQWWRYLIARWGYSTAVHSWESCNEADPNDPNVWRHTQSFGRFLRETNAHRHMATTSFWCCWVPEFWQNHAEYPDVAYADLHEYTNDTAFGLDMAAWVLHLADLTNETPVGKPVMLAETGIGHPGQSAYEQLKTANPGLWYHNLLWAQLNGASGLTIPNYWWAEHFAVIDRNAVARPFFEFVSRLDIHRGGYTDAGATTSNVDIRVIGQKNDATGSAYLWIQNRRHTWHNVSGVGGTPPDAQSGTVTIRLAPGETYTVERWNTYAGNYVSSEHLVASPSGDLTITVSGLMDDFALRIRGVSTGSPRAPRGLRFVW